MSLALSGFGLRPHPSPPLGRGRDTTSHDIFTPSGDYSLSRRLAGEGGGGGNRATEVGRVLALTAAGEAGRASPTVVGEAMSAQPSPPTSTATTRSRGQALTGVGLWARIRSCDPTNTGR